jgi:hypothetical protein
MIKNAIAQTFFVPSEFEYGMYLSSIDLFFKSVDATDNKPVLISVVETDKGVPTDEVLGTVTVNNEGIAHSTTKLLETNILFATPLFLAPQKTYAIVLHSTSSKYVLWTAKVGEVDITNKSKTVSKQPYSGVLYKMSNGFWVETPDEDLTFRVNRAVYSAGTAGSGIFYVIPSLPTVLLGSNPFKITNAETLVRVYHPNHGKVAGMFVTFSGSTYADLNDTFEVMYSFHPDTYVVELPSPAASTDLVGGNVVYATQDVRYDTFSLATDIEADPNTEFSTALKTANSTSLDTKFVQFDSDRDTSVSENKFIHSDINRTNLLSGDDTLAFQLGIWSNINHLTPKVDVESLGMVFVGNRINNPQVTDNLSAIDNETIFSASTGLSFSSTDNSISSATVDLQRFKTGAYVVITGSSSNNTTADGVMVIDVDFSTTTHKVYLNTTVVNETLSTSTTIVQKNGYIDEISPDAGSAAAKYITIPVDLETISSSLRVMFAANIPLTAEIDLYYRATVKNSVKGIREYPWVNVPTTYRKNLNSAEFLDQKYDIDIGAFNTFQVKVVFRSTNAALVPRLKDFRAIALV